MLYLDKQQTGNIKNKAMKNKSKRIQRLSMRMTLYFSIVIAVTYVALALLISNLFSGRLLREMDDVLVRKMNIVNSELSGALVQIQNLHASIVNDNTMRTSMARIERSGVDTGTMALVQGRLTNFARGASYITSIVAIESGGHILHSYYSLPPYPKLVAASQEYQDFRNSARTRAFTSPDAFPLAVGQDTGSITYLGRLYDARENYSITGTVTINLKTSFLFGNIQSLTQDSFDACFLTAPDGSVVYQTGRDGFESMPPDAVDASFRVYETQVSSYPDWKLVCVVRQSEFLAALGDTYRIVVIMSLISLVCVVIVSFYISKTVTQPIKQIRTAMVQLGIGEYPQPLETRAAGEMQDLVLGFNVMVEDIRRLTEEIVEKQKKENEYEVAMVQTQLDMLQLQINPHFIHNTLNTMKYMAQVEQNNALADTITAFNALLRASMSSSGALASVAEEINNTENYLRLQRNRYEFDIHFTCGADEDVLLALLPKLILQPIVENALFHGIAPAGGGTIALRVRRRGDMLEVSISDDGVGMDSEKLRRLAARELDDSRGYSHVGLKNVNDRLILLYGAESLLKIKSREGHGSTISFCIPFTT